MSLSTLNTLSDLQNLTSGISSIYNAAQNADQSVSNAISSTAKSALSFQSRYVVIALGFIVIAAGLFSFDKTREIVVQAGKTAATAAAAA